MIRYARHQVLVLLMGLAAAGAGLAVREWRAAHPDLVDRLEQFDREPPSGEHPAAPDPSPPATASALDLNRATLEDLARLPGVGPILATRILEARLGAGRFASVDDLQRVRGLGDVRLERLRSLVTVSAP